MNFCTFLYSYEDNRTGKLVLCGECHSKQEFFKTFENGDKVNVFVDVKWFNISAHRNLKCIKCHLEFRDGNHPIRRFRSYEQYKVMLSRRCIKCHNKEIKEPIHKSFIEKNKSDSFLLCTNCHSAHYTTKTITKEVISEDFYCIKCHKNEIAIIFKDKNSFNIKVDLDELKNSVHKNLICSDCHFGFSDEVHPKRILRSRRDLRVVNSDTCRRCHFDKYTMNQESIHYTFQSKGKKNVPVCADCHGAHGIRSFGKERIAIAKKCGNCHYQVFNIYKNSAHGRALLMEDNYDVPICIDCHTAHEIENPLSVDYRDRTPEICSKCHSNKDVMDKYGLSTDVVKTYLSDFHGITLKFYREQREKSHSAPKEIATCIDCHGTHDIISIRLLDVNTIKKRLLKRCKRCHTYASSNFPDAWLSHYIPTLNSAPVIFIINLIYKVFIPLLIISIFLQILLHIWRYAIKR